MKKLTKVVLSVGLLTALFVGTGASLMAAGGCCDPVNCCKGECHCPCCNK